MQKGNVFTSVCPEFCPQGGVQAQARGVSAQGVQAQALGGCLGPGPGGCPDPGCGVSRPRSKGVCIPACTEADTPQQMSTVVDGAQPTGMHSFEMRCQWRIYIDK